MLVKDLLKKNSVYTAIHNQLTEYEKAYLGGRAFKEHVRKKRPSEDSNLWQDLISNTALQPICRYIVDTINDVLFSTGARRNIQFCTPNGAFIDSRNTEWADLFLLDADLNNNSLPAVMEQIGDLTSIFGHCWVAVDMPPAGTAQLGRPYVVAVNPLNVWDWEYDMIGGRPMLEYVKILECETDESLYFKCYHLGDSSKPSYWRSYEVEKSDLMNPLAQAELEGWGEFPLGMSLPIFQAFGRRDPRRIDIGISDIDFATDAQKEHYKLECEAYSAIQFAHTIIRAETGIKIPVHAGAIVRATKDQVEAIAVDTGDVSTITSKQNDILENLEALTGLSGLRSSKTSVQSGVSIIEERKQLHRIAKSKARLMEMVEETIFTYAARYMGVRWAGEIQYNTDYESSDTVFRTALVKEAKLIAPEEPVITALINKELITMLAPKTQTQEYVSAYIDSMPDSAIKQLMIQTEQVVFSRDLAPSMIPLDLEYDEQGNVIQEDSDDEESDMDSDYESENDSIGSTEIIDTGVSYTPLQSQTSMINNISTGR